MKSFATAAVISAFAVEQVLATNIRGTSCVDTVLVKVFNMINNVRRLGTTAAEVNGATDGYTAAVYVAGANAYW